MIKAQPLTRNHGRTIAFDGASFTVQPGLVTGFLGPDGAVKSTTMRMILGLDTPSSSEVRVKDKLVRPQADPLRSVGALLDAKALVGRPRCGVMTSIQINGLTKHFGDVVAVDNLSFEVAQGSITGFLGPNGAGKTTTLRMLLGLIEPTSGSSKIAGKPYQELVNPFRHVRAVLESKSFHPGRRACDHLRVLCVAAGLAVSRADEVLDEVGLGDVGDWRVKGFSLGMRQRLGLAAALFGEPEVLILDEPANGLDPEDVHWLNAQVEMRGENPRFVAGSWQHMYGLASMGAVQ